MTLVSDLLRSKHADVWTIAPEATVYKALELMAEKNVGALPVVENDRVVGMFSERDYARKVILVGKSSRLTTVGELMSHPVIWVGPSESIETCMELMTNHRVRHLPIIVDGQLVGLLSSGDILRTIVANQQVTIDDLQNFITGGRS